MAKRDESVLETYDRIFGKDPLLLAEGSQKAYGRGLLKHLLINRTISTSVPHFVNLHNAKSRRGFLRSDREPPPPPSATVRRHYLDALIHRRSLSRGDFLALKNITMVCDGALTHRRLTADFCDHEAAVRQLEEKKAGSPIDCRLRIAAIGRRVRISKIPNIGHLDEDLCALPEVAERVITDLPEDAGVKQLGRTKPVRRADGTGWHQAVMTHIKQALGHRCHVVLLPEFALPSANDESHKDGIDEVIKKLSETAQQDHFLFAGSRHEGSYNRGLIFSRQNGKVSNKWWHYKVASARNLGENILGPYGDKIPSYLTTFRFHDDVDGHFAITVAICYDAFDPTMFLNLILQAVTSDADFLDKIILVPSFNPSEDFVALLRDLSFLARCPVVYVNGLHGNAKMFVCGFAISDLTRNLPEVRSSLTKMIAKIRKKFSAAARAVGRDISKNRTSRRRRQQRKEMNDLKNKLAELENLQSGLSVLADSHAFDHLITVEHCAECRAGGDHKDSICNGDVLYYNIDIGLLSALTRFRTKYFQDDTFLPEPLRVVELDRARKWMESRSRKRGLITHA